MYDATAKIPSGLLNGNVNQLGDFDECVETVGIDGIQGQYCLAYLQLDIDESRPDLKHLHRLLHSHYIFRSNVTDVSAAYIRVSKRKESYFVRSSKCDRLDGNIDDNLYSRNL